MVVVRAGERGELYSTVRTPKVKNDSGTLTEETRKNDNSLY